MYNDFVIKFIAMDRVVQTLDLEPEIVEPPERHSPLGQAGQHVGPADELRLS